MSKKIKILTLSDHPLSPSGVGTQTRYIIEALLKTGKFQVLSLGGAIKHQDYTPKMVEPWNVDSAIPPLPSMSLHCLFVSSKTWRLASCSSGQKLKTKE